MGVASWKVLHGEDPEFVSPSPPASCAWVSQLRPLVAELSKPGDMVFDPFAGWGSTLVACAVEGRRGIGLEISPQRVEEARRRLAGYPGQTMLCGDARKPALPPESVGLVLTDIPYFGTQVAESAPTGTFYSLRQYDEYLGALDDAFAAMATVLCSGAHMAVSVQNRRFGGRFVPLAWDAARILGRYLTLGDERIHLYNKPASGDDATVTNRAHEYVLVAKKP